MSYILVTNDDGINAAGLLALQTALREVAKVVVFAPDHNWSAAGHTKTMHKPLRVQEVTLPDDTPAYACSGAPSDCVALVMLGFLEQQGQGTTEATRDRPGSAQGRPLLVVSGINQGANVGHDITYSGTIAAAMEAVISGLPAIAVSLDSYESSEFGPAARFAARLAQEVLQRGLPPNTFLNVNVPAMPAERIAGVRVTRLGRRVYRDVLIERRDPRGKPYYWIGGEPPGGVTEIEGTDIWALAHGYISVTPLQMDMTAYPLLEELRQWEFNRWNP